MVFLCAEYTKLNKECKITDDCTSVSIYLYARCWWSFRIFLEILTHIYRWWYDSPVNVRFYFAVLLKMFSQQQALGWTENIDRFISSAWLYFQNIDCIRLSKFFFFLCTVLLFTYSCMYICICICMYTSYNLSISIWFVNW